MVFLEKPEFVIKKKYNLKKKKKGQKNHHVLPNLKALTSVKFGTNSSLPSLAKREEDKFYLCHGKVWPVSSRKDLGNPGVNKIKGRSCLPGVSVPKVYYHL